jgi:hypothetical protein
MILLMILTQFELADSLYAHQDVELARVEYERVFFADPVSFADSARPRMNLAFCRVATNDLGGREALDSLARIWPDLKPRILSFLARYYLNAGNYPAADEYAMAADEPRLTGYARLKDERLTEARDAFYEAREDRLAAAIDDFKTRPRKSALTASILSFLCPGSGEMYSGNIRLGVTDLLLNAGSGFLLYNALRQKEYVDAGLIVSFLINRFYFGSIRNAQRTAEEYNEKKYQRWLEGLEREYFQDLVGQ